MREAVEETTTEGDDRDGGYKQTSCAAEYEAVLSVQTTPLTALDWQLDATTRYTAGNGTMSLNAADPNEFARTEPLGLESGVLSVEIQVDNYIVADPKNLNAHNWLTIGIGTGTTRTTYIHTLAQETFSSHARRCDTKHGSSSFLDCVLLKRLLLLLLLL